jgi:hypothetical protein
MTKIFIAQKLGVNPKELGMEIEPSPIGDIVSDAFFCAASYSFF